MGLDISFSKSEALSAGLRHTYSRRGTDEEILHAEDSGHREWLQEMVDLISLDGKSWRDADIFDDSISVRANKWGTFYTPLVTFLNNNHITFGEF
jgi:hypothetical protein